jgi:hypothetical protein
MELMIQLNKNIKTAEIRTAEQAVEIFKASLVDAKLISVYDQLDLVLTRKEV